MRQPRRPLPTGLPPAFRVFRRASPVLCIPSPDVLLNLFASAAQLLGLLALCLGGSFVTKRRHPGLSGRGPASAVPLTVTCLLLVGVSAAFLLYHLAAVDAENRRLRANLVRSSTEDGKKVGDVNLKTLSYSAQTKHPRGATTEQLAAWLAAGKPLNLIDVREDEEAEMGRIAGTWHRRYPDLQADASDLIVAGRETVLLCESGNRSSELCEYFHGQGIATKFMVGGYEKWVAEGREIDGADGGRDDLRAVPDFPNKDVLLTTDEVVRMFTTENALFVDVRYPGDWELGHLPGAECVPLRKLTSDEARAAIAALPRRPIIVPCYDKRSSFYALILGVRLSRLGYDFRGRYTVPHEFTLPKAESEWVARWNAANAERTLFGTARNAAVATLGFGTRELGSLGLAIVAIALLLRALMLPLSLKADRDGVVQARLKPMLRQLRQQLADDPVRASRAAVDALRQARITPLRNFLGSLGTLLLFAVVFAAVERLSATSVEGVAWLRWSEPDPYLLLPAIAGVLLAAIAWLGANGSRRGRVIAVVFAAVITWLVVGCRAGVQLYLVVSFALLLTQSLAVRRFLSAERRTARRRALTPGAVVPLREAGFHPELGGKATRLGDVVAAGFAVPPGFVVAPGPFDARALDAAFVQLGASQVAVRSSAQGEDGAHSSFAGSFHTELRVQRADLARAVDKVRASYGGREGGVLVQVMVDADHAGVLFTEDPAHAGRALIEMVAGTGEALVSGTAIPTEHRFGRVTGERIGAATAGPDLQPLLAAGRRLEELFGAPQDIEWAHAGGRFLLLQSRNSTPRLGDGGDAVAAREAERALLLRAVAGAPADVPVFTPGDHTTLLPEPTAISLELMQAIHAPGGAVDHACRRLGLTFTAGERDLPAVRAVFGRCCADLRAANRIRTGAGAAFRLGLRSPELERGLVTGFLPDFLRAARLRETMALDQLSLPELQQLRRETWQRFLTSTYVEAEMINLAAEAYVASARRALERKGLDAAALLGHGVHTIVGEAYRALSLEDGASRFVALFGHRAGHDFELSEPRFRERPRIVDRMTSHAAPVPAAVPAGPPLPEGKVTRTALLRARRFVELKEEAKHAAMHDLAFLRRVLLAIGARTGLQHRVFELTSAEIDRLDDASDHAPARALAEQRARQRTWLLAVQLPAEITPAALERVGEQQALPAIAPRGLRGLRVAGDRDVTGTVRVLHDPEQLDRLGQGDILVVRHTDPCWMPAFRRAGGLVSEVGGWLSHASIQAREHNLPAIVGVANATALLRDGDLVCLRRDGSIETQSEIRIA